MQEQFDLSMGSIAIDKAIPGIKKIRTVNKKLKEFQRNFAEDESAKELLEQAKT